MARWLGILLVLSLAAPVNAQVFKPKGKKADVIEKKPAKKAAAKKAPAAKKKATKGKKSAVAERSRPDDLTPEPSSKNEDADFVKITDDEDIE